MNSPNVTVMVLSYNYGRFLHRAINSILNQTYQDFEIIIIDDCSTDNTPEIATSFTDKRIRYIRQPYNVGQAISRNTAIQHAKGEFIAILDADDWWDEKYLAESISPFIDKNVGLVYTLKKGHNETGDIVNFPLQKAVRGKITNELFVLNFIGISIIFRKSIASGGFKTDLCPEWNNMGTDWWFALEISTKHNIVGIDKPLYNYYIHEGQMSGRHASRRRIEADRIIQEKFLQLYPEHVSTKWVKKARFWSFIREGYYQRRSGLKWQACLSYLKSWKVNPFASISYKGLLITLIKG